MNVRLPTIGSASIARWRPLLLARAILREFLRRTSAIVAAPAKKPVAAAAAA